MKSYIYIIKASWLIFRLKKILPLRVWVTRNSDILLKLNKKIAVDRSAVVMDTRVCAVEIPILKYIGAISLQVHSQYLEVSYGASHRSQY